MKTISENKEKRKFFSKKKLSEKQLEAIRAKRTELKEISKPIKELVKLAVYNTINEGLVELYATQGHINLKTLKQWNEAGKSIIKGEHALLLWGSPKKLDKKIELTIIEGDEKETDFYPLCFVFSELQVIERSTAA